MGLYAQIKQKIFGTSKDDYVEKKRGGASNMMMMLMGGGNSDGKSQEEILKAYHSDPMLHACVKSIAQAVAGAELHATRNGKELESHDLLGLLTRPNQYHSRYSFLTLLSSYLDLLGEVFIFILKTSMGVELIPLSPTCLTQEDDSTYTVLLGGAEIPKAKIGKNLVRITAPDLSEPYTSGVGYGQVLSQELDISESAAQHEAAFLKNNARPDLIINLPGLGEDETKSFSEAFNSRHKGASNSGKAAVLNASDLNVQMLTQSFKDIGLIPLRQHNADLIRQAFGIPPEILGDVKNSNRATIEAADFIFKRNVVTPRLTMIITELSMKLIPLLYPQERGLELGFKSVVPADKEFTLKVMQAKPEAFSINESRALAGSQFEDVSGGDELVQRNLSVAHSSVQKVSKAIHTRPEPLLICGSLGGSKEEIYFKNLSFSKLAKELQELT